MPPEFPIAIVRQIPITEAFSVIDFGGVFAGALGGAFAAKADQRFQFDFVGVVGLGLISALGGGVARDVLIGHGPPLAFQDVRYLLVGLLGALVGLLLSSQGRRLRQGLLLVDAAGLGFFAVAGSARALAAGMRFLPAALLGITTAVGGGSLRDVFSGRTPKVFERGQPYATVAAVSSVVFLVAERRFGPGTVATVLGCVTGFVLRVVALKLRWRTSAAR